MSAYPKRDTAAEERVLASIERAMAEKAQAGRASEVRHGLVARVANATPPMRAGLRSAIWARILATGTEEASSARPRQDRALASKARSFALVAMTAALVAALAFAFTRAQVVEWNGFLSARSGAAERLTSEDLNALTEAINGAPAPRTVLAYSRHASPIADRVRYKTVPLLLGEDVTPTSIQDAVEALLPPNGYVDLVAPAVHESDTAYEVRAAMEQTLYHLYQPSGLMATEAYGALERNTYLVGPEHASQDPIGAQFEGGVELVAGGVVDALQAGMPVRVALDWRVQEPTSGSFVVFVHLQRGDLELVAQRDAVPGNGLFPVEQWRPGELVRDQFALQLPAELPAGTYELRVGLYDAKTQMRYPLAEPGQGTYVVVQDWVLVGPGQGDLS